MDLSGDLDPQDQPNGSFMKEPQDGSILNDVKSLRDDDKSKKQHKNTSEVNKKDGEQKAHNSNA